MSSGATTTWDYVIIGTGMGGATLGYALAMAGKSVLFCERGHSYLANGLALRGRFAESFFPRHETAEPKHADLLNRSGRYSFPVIDVSSSAAKAHIPFLGSGTGGSSAIYGMALERFFPRDFAPRRNFTEPGLSTIPDRWPLTYEELGGYYSLAERLFRVRGGVDPCRPSEECAAPLLTPPKESPVAGELCGFLSEKGLHPYRIPLACEYVPGCECCQGYLCARGCKNDAARICLRPAIDQHGAVLLDECEVVRLEADARRVTGVLCRHKGSELRLRAGNVILAAGGLGTPQLLLKSTSDCWPTGLANRMGLVGRNLMRHYVDLYLVKTKIDPSTHGHFKELAFNDFYYADGQKYGTVQSFGSLPPIDVLLSEQKRELRDHGRQFLAGLFGLARPLIRPFVARHLTRRVVLASIMEDLPFEDNQVTLPDPAGQLHLQYRIREHERARIDAFRTRVRAALEPYPVTLIKQAENNERLAHVCGTCRLGEDPDRSVLNPFNRAHDLENLYVADASCFPSSGGTNPGLTIAALSLRLAEHLLGSRNSGLSHLLFGASGP